VPELGGERPGNGPLVELEHYDGRWEDGNFDGR
jgi:hypothetical protein